MIGAGLIGSQVARILVERGEKPVLMDFAAQPQAISQIVVVVLVRPRPVCVSSAAKYELVINLKIALNADPFSSASYCAAPIELIRGRRTSGSGGLAQRSGMLGRCHRCLPRSPDRVGLPRRL